VVAAGVSAVRSLPTLQTPSCVRYVSKRVFDLSVATTGLILLLPVLLLIALAVRIDSKGPAIFRQDRVGRFGVVFRIHKFRTMKADHSRGGSLITVDRDPRITRVGHVLRRLKLDELPQLFDVLAGDMSIVGPRPEVPEYVAIYPAGLRDQILSIRPGITDEASILVRDESRLLGNAADPQRLYVEEIMPRKLELCARYAATHTFLGDLRIIGRTIGFFFRE